MAMTADIITADANYTKQMQAQGERVTGMASMKLEMTDFFQLLMQELKSQDPTSGSMDSKQFVSEMCQFAQLNVSTETHDLMSDYVGESKAQSLLGKDVILKDPNNKDQQLAGTVEAVSFNGKKSSITVNGTDYSMDYLLYSYDKNAIADAIQASINANPNTDVDVDI